MYDIQPRNAMSSQWEWTTISYIIITTVCITRVHRRGGGVSLVQVDLSLVDTAFVEI